MQFVKILSKPEKQNTRIISKQTGETSRDKSIFFANSAFKRTAFAKKSMKT